MDLRCPSRIKFGELDDSKLEVVCRSDRCGKAPGVVVIHTFDTVTGELLGTERFKEPQERS